ncbi:2718_t:CDS:2 [Ambispora gerdemannii]|uniref:2718_t:CDS:1 n=1 Tax=Ambispora gerdemannii TaxID=144530 RepID=A0A9N9A9G2_9GLOM|nr:2718_t:CDS:2 [Ambispora gerdemannii]
MTAVVQHNHPTWISLDRQALLCGLASREYRDANDGGSHNGDMIGRATASIERA